MVSYANNTQYTNLGLMLSALWQREVVNASAVAGLYSVLTSSRAVERSQGLGQFGEVPEYNGTIEYAEPTDEDLTTYTHKEYALGLSIPRKLIDDDEYGRMTTMVQQHALAFTRTQATHMSSVFVNAFSSSYLGGDGKALCAARNSGKQVLTNKGTSALTHDNVVSTRQAMRQFKDNQGNVLMVMPDTLIVPVALEAVADEIVNSAGRSDNANNAVNSNRAMSYIVDPFLTDTNDWFLVDSQLARQYLKWFWRVLPEFTTDPASDFNLGMKMRGYMRYSFGWDATQWIYGHQVS